MASVGKSAFGGGRGLFATSDIKKGQVVLVESPWLVSTRSCLDPWWALTVTYIYHLYYPATLTKMKRYRKKVAKRPLAWMQKELYNAEPFVHFWDENDDLLIEMLYRDIRNSQEARPKLTKEEIKKVHEYLNSSALELLPRPLALQPQQEVGTPLGMFTTLGLVNHSCTPNCMTAASGEGTIVKPKKLDQTAKKEENETDKQKKTDKEKEKDKGRSSKPRSPNDSLSLVANEDIKAGSELTLGYRCLQLADSKERVGLALLDVKTRQEWLKKVFNFTCACKACKTGFVDTSRGKLDVSKVVFK